MATLLDVGILEHFGSIFVVILLFAVVFGVLEATKPFGGDKKGLYAILALFVAAMFLTSVSATNMIKVMVPWFIVVVVFIFFSLLLFRMFGVGDDTFKAVIGDTALYPWVIIFAILVLFGALGSVFGQSFLEAGGGGSGPVMDGNYSADASGGAYPGGAGYPMTTTSTTTSNFGVNLMNTLRHPKILGMIFILLTGAFLAIFLTKSAVVK